MSLLSIKKKVSQNISLQIQTTNQQNSLLAHNFVNSKFNLLSRKKSPSLTSVLQQIGLLPNLLKISSDINLMLQLGALE